MYLKLSKARYWLVGLVTSVIITACRVVLIGAYDENVDQSIQRISTEISTLMVKVEKNLDDNLPDQNKYENFRDVYINLYGEVENLKIRTMALPKYGKITEMVVLLDKNIHTLEALHKTGFTNRGVIAATKTLIEQSLKSMLSAQNALKRESV
ncbi:MAG: hypothetical protein EOP46_02130 [Sphingobacteriaceae bacterium]|nr:MAG: hypothetical protein EOP46_02130 [Sphingobacteriaceae bacterium]